MRMNSHTNKEIKGWHRFELKDHILYVQPDIPDWIVVSEDADQLLHSEKNVAARFYGRDQLEHAFGMEPLEPYAGRASLLSLKQLKECWFHITDTCNLSCRHCLFAASPAKTRTLAPEILERAVQQALALGCRLFSFTGGEPFLYPDFLQFIRRLLLENEDVHVAVLTNGMLLDRSLEELSTLDRIHIQVSLDGLETSHDRLRGRGSYRKLTKNLRSMKAAGIPVTLSVAISSENIGDLLQLVDLAAELGAASIHLLYHFIRGKGSQEQFITPDTIFPHLIAAWQRATELGLSVDNVETLRSQVFSTPGTRYDLSNTAWESVAVGPDGTVYPSPALVGMEETACGNLDQGLGVVWKTSPVLNELRQTSLVHSQEYSENPLKFLVGGGDIDHSFMSGNVWVGHDPYVSLYNRIALQLISDQAGRYKRSGKNGILLRMGDVRHDCPDGEEEGHEVALTHCNCLISLASDAGHGSVREFYGAAALVAKEDIVNPLAPAQAEADFISDKTKKHSYGCGSPVTDGAPQAGETLVDLGSGSGVECFMASASVGKTGQVYGIDMTDEMLKLAGDSLPEVAERLGYNNVEFRKGFLEQIPLDSAVADVVISNCVINLSPDKRMTYQEIFRILKPGGRLVVSDIVTDTAIPATLKNNIRYRGECLGGAMQQEELVAMMEGAGFSAIRFIKRFPYRQVENMDFFSLTYEAVRPIDVMDESIDVIYRGPYGAVHTESGILLVKGRRTSIPLQERSLLDDSVFVVDTRGAVTNLLMENSCCSPQTDISDMRNSCCSPGSAECCDGDESDPVKERKAEGCMVCGTALHYFIDSRDMGCSYCGRTFASNACCEKEHFVCDACHRENGIEVIKAICSGTKERDLIALLELIRSHPAIPMHGPEHHAMIPGIILACYRNSGGDIKEEAILTGISRGADIPGGVCGFWGACGAAIGAGIAVSTIFSATPLTPAPRQTAQAFSAKILEVISKYRGGRCCQRETWLALSETARLSAEMLSVPMVARGVLRCSQYSKNKECIRKQCPLWENRVKKLEPELRFLS
ncbi:methyltransferase domain-containing protein [Methanococcoides sp. SA1]|nr:methyltransferase domain-containing protein [Methanococcoides sp. SA1]